MANRKEKNLVSSLFNSFVLRIVTTLNNQPITYPRMPNIAKSPIQAVLVAITILLSLLIQYPSPDLDRPYYRALATNFTKSQDDKYPLLGTSIIITGATSGLGLSLANYLHGLGSTIIAVGRSPSKLEKLQKDLDKEGNKKRIVPVVADLSDLNSVSAAGKQIKSKFKRVDFLVNNAGMVHSSEKEYQTTAQGYDSVFGGEGFMMRFI